MRLLADENFPLPSIRRLRESGYEIEAVAELAPGMPDSAVLAHAQANQQVLLTFDRDFGELIYRRGAPVPPGVVYLRLVPANPQEAGDLIQKLLTAKAVHLEGRFTVLERERIRQRPLLKIL
jgi:predicted nuclease of predicted toxin-antitoxin system